MEQEFSSVFSAAMDASGDDVVQRIERNRREIEETLEEVRSQMDAALPDTVGVGVEPWFSTTEFAGKQVAFKKQDGFEAKAFTVQISLEGYPVTVRVGDQELTAENHDELVAHLKAALKHPTVAATARYLQED